MSWLFGIYGKNNSTSLNFSSEEKYTSIQQNNLQLFVGENPHTSFIYKTENDFFAFVGLPLYKQSDQIKLLSHLIPSENIFSNDDNLFGHYVILQYNKGILKIKNDVLGLREVYYIKKTDRIIFSTRIDLILNYVENASINFEEFSSLWLTNFQLSHKSILNEINRLGPNGFIIADNNNIKIENSKFEKKEISNPSQKFAVQIKTYCSTKISDLPLTLALSGGIDSRLVLSELLKSKQKFKCHTIINEDNYDLKLASKICKTFNIEHTILKRDEISLADNESEILRLYKNIPPIIPITQLLDFNIFGKSFLSKHFIVDGGFGGFYRKQYFKKLLYKGYKFFDKKNLENIKSILTSPKPLIFNSNVTFKMYNSQNSAIELLIDTFDIPKSRTEFAEILDLLAINYVLPNVYGPGQTLLDQDFISFMPLAQKNIINSGLNLTLKQKIDSKFFKNFISNHYNELTQFNLVNNNLEYPFSLNYKIAMIYLLLYKKLQRKKNFSRYNVFLNSKSFIYELLKSGELQNSKYLDIQKSISEIDLFYKGDYSKGNYVDWFLTFVFWSKANNIII